MIEFNGIPLGAPRPQPESDVYWQGISREELLIPRCTDCSRFHFYPRPLCPFCHSGRLTWVRSAGFGSVYTFTIVHKALHPSLKNCVPYVPALVDLDEGVRLPTCLLVDRPDPDFLSIGMAVQLVFSTNVQGTFAAFEPLDSESADIGPADNG